MSTLDRDQRKRVAALVKARNGEYFNLLAHESDLDVLRQFNWQIKRLPKSERGAMLNERLLQLTGKRPADGMSGFQRWYGRATHRAAEEARA